MRNAVRVAGLLLCVGLVSPASFGQVVPFWRMRDLGSGPWFSWARGVNDEGWIVGSFEMPQNVWHAAIWDPDGNLLDLGALGGDDSELEAVNQDGAAAGYVIVADVGYGGVVRTAAGGLVELEELEIGGNSHPYSITDDRTVVGGTWIAGISRAIMWPSGATTPIDLGVIAGAQSTEAYDCNSHLQVCGTGSRGEPYFRTAFLWTEIDGLQPLVYEAGTHSEAWGINDAGTVAGTAYGLDMMPQAAVWQADSGWTLLPLLNTANASYGYDINDAGWVVGVQQIIGPSIGRATVWDASGMPYELPTLSYGTSNAYRINDRNRIVGWASSSDGATHAAVWFRTTHGDTDEDCDVDLTDLTRLLGSYGCCTGDPCFLAGADVSPNGCVDLNDLSILLGRFGNVCP